MAKTTLFIEGMTCKNCEHSVHQKLSSLSGVQNVIVSLQEAKASFVAEQEIVLGEIQVLLGEKYSISLEKEKAVVQKKSKLRQLFPLFLILFYVAAGALFLSNGLVDDYFLTAFMGLFFIVFSFFKFLDYTSFPASFQQYDPIAKKSRFYAYAYPFIETFLGLCFLFQFEMEKAAGLTLILLTSTSVGVLQSLRKKQTITCACLGTVLDLPMTEATLIENLLMILMAIGILMG